MAREINLTSQKWNDIIFEGKNKDYGAYEMRKSSSKRHIVALIVIALLVAFISFLPLLIKTITPSRGADNIDTSNVLADIKQLEDQVKEKDIIREVAAEPPPVLKQTIQFVAPEIVSAKDITEDDEMKSQSELAATDIQISVATVDGVKDGGIDIADLKDHKVIVEAKDEIFDFVEQMPEFPGGNKERVKYFQRNQKYPEIAQMNGIQGKVTVQFVVGMAGEITEIEVIGGVKDRSLQAEATRLVKSMPRWIPGKQNGQAVRVRHKIDIVFAMQE